MGLTRPLRLGDAGQDVEVLHRYLATLGLHIDGVERADLRFGITTHHALCEAQRRLGLPVLGVADEQTTVALATAAQLRPPAEPERLDGAGLIRGTVRDAGGVPAARVRVRAFDRHLRERRPVGEAVTDADGAFEIRYPLDQNGAAEPAAPNLVVVAEDGSGLEIGASTTAFRAPPAVQVEVRLTRALADDSELTRLQASVAPLLGRLELADVTAADQEFLAGHTGAPVERISRLVWAERAARDSGVDLALVYALASQNLPADMKALAHQPAASLVEVVRRAIRERVVPRAVADGLRERIERLERVLASQVMPSELQIGLSRETQDAFARAYLQRTGDLPGFWKALRERPDLGCHVDELQRSLQLGVLALGHPPMIERLHELLDGKQWSSLEGLATLDEAAWRALARATGAPEGLPGRDAEARTCAYARVLEGLVERAFPAARLLARLRADDGPRSIEKPDVLHFLSANPKFDLRRMQLAVYLAGAGPGALEGIGDPARLSADLSRMQRVLQIGPRYEQMRALLDGGIDSARAVVRLGQTAFVAQFGPSLGGPDEAARTYARAVHASFTALAIYGRYAPSINPLDLVATRRAP